MNRQETCNLRIKHRIKAIYGENGSGKTAIITSVKLLQNLLMDKSYLADYDTQRSLVGFRILQKQRDRQILTQLRFAT